MKYRAGHNETRFSPLSVEYCRRAKTHLATLGSPLADGPLPAVDFYPENRIGLNLIGPSLLGPLPLRPTPIGGRVVRVGGRLQRVAGRPLKGARFWAVHTARIKAIEARLPWKRGGIMAGG